ncbi:cytochrome P450 714C2-like [Andrographis paniculata]|uniref:cytochrome P450 714C2-like n=1 Tax=Andrographis paniculata TaxID=175694 RepID=UPI0021E837C5|nr:cytochrome P450 714C2-like [Andrographis paniculata]
MGSSFEYLATLFGFLLVMFPLSILFFQWWITPWMFCKKLRANGFSGPNPNFPLGNLNQIKYQNPDTDISKPSSVLTGISNDTHSTLFPYFASWQKSHGKVFVFWAGTAPFLYVADPEFLKQMSGDIKGKDWGKADVFKRDRTAIFAKSLVANEGDEWARRKHFITPAFATSSLKATAALGVEAAKNMVDQWSALINSGDREIDVEAEIIPMLGGVAAKMSCGMSVENGKRVLSKLRALQWVLFEDLGHVGVPYGKLLSPIRTMRARKLGKEIDEILYSVIKERVSGRGNGGGVDFLESMMAADGGRIRPLAAEEMVDECKAMFFAAFETTGLALSWSLLQLAAHPKWQIELREEIREVVEDREIGDVSILHGLKKMGWVMNEVIRLYGSVPNIQRQARHDIQVGDKVIPRGTNIWIDIVSMHHDRTLWGEDANEFKPERFENDIYGGCNHKMGYLPFGFGGRLCVGKNLTTLQYRAVLATILSKFSVSLSPRYCHSPTIILALRPKYGIPLILQNL